MKKEILLKRYGEKKREIKILKERIKRIIERQKKSNQKNKLLNECNKIFILELNNQLEKFEKEKEKIKNIIKMYKTAFIYMAFIVVFRLVIDLFLFI